MLNRIRRPFSMRLPNVASLCCILLFGPNLVFGNDLPIADAHIHYSHDSVELTPPEKVIEIMQEANLKFALVSSSDDNGTQLLSELAPDLIVPGLRPYRRRGETNSWFTDENALAYVEKLLEQNRYATIGEFHLFGKNADNSIPRKIVQLAVKHNLILHAHSDADAVERLLKQDDTVKIIWAHSGFEEPDVIADMLARHDRLWADLAFRSEVGSGGTLSNEWRELFEAHPTRMMLGTDTYTPERMYFIPEHAKGSRVWLNSLPQELAENIAWRNAYQLIMPHWSANRATSNLSSNSEWFNGEHFVAVLTPVSALRVSEATDFTFTVCGPVADIERLEFDATMPAHGHGTNYTPKVSLLTQSASQSQYQIQGVVLHMPGVWQWEATIHTPQSKISLTKDVELR